MTLISIGAAALAWSERNRALEARDGEKKATEIASNERDKATASFSRLQVSSTALNFIRNDDNPAALSWLAEVLKHDSENDTRAYVHRVRYGMYVRSLPRLLQTWSHQSLAKYAEFSPDGRWIATANGQSYGRGNAWVWDAKTGQPASPLLEHKGTVYLATFSPDSTKIVTAGGDKVVRI